MSKWFVGPQNGWSSLIEPGCFSNKVKIFYSCTEYCAREWAFWYVLIRYMNEEVKKSN